MTHSAEDWVAKLRRVSLSLQDRSSDLDNWLPTIREAHAHVRRTHRDLVEQKPDDGPLAPPAELVPVLRFLGWAIYEASMVAIGRIKLAYVVLPSEDQDASIKATQQIKELAHLAQSSIGYRKKAPN